MVNNQNKILDEGRNKFLPEVKMSPALETMDKRVRLIQREFIERVPVWDSEEEEYVGEGMMDRNPAYDPDPPSAVKKWIEADDILLNPETARWMKNKILADANLKKSLYGYFGIIPFNPCVMINISPDWKDKIPIEGKKGKPYIRLLNNAIHDYLNTCNRYSKYRYCLECGGEGNFLHAHIVAEINPDLHKSVMTHINKGNHKYELMKMWDKNLTNEKSLDYEKFKSGKEKGSEGLLKGKFAVQRIIINNEAMRDDKLAYLKEENKPDGHRNAYDLNFIKGDF